MGHWDTWYDIGLDSGLAENLSLVTRNHCEEHELVFPFFLDFGEFYKVTKILKGEFWKKFNKEIENKIWVVIMLNFLFFFVF